MSKDNSRDFLIIDSSETARGQTTKQILKKLIGDTPEFSNGISPFQRRGKGKAKNRKDRWS